MLGVIATTRVSPGQTTLPQYYIDQSITHRVDLRWIGEPPGWTHDPRFLAVPKVNVGLPPAPSGQPPNDSDPVQAANTLMAYVQQRLAGPNPTLHPGDIPVAVSSLAHCKQSGEIHPEWPTCLHHPDDYIGSRNDPPNPSELEWSTPPVDPPQVGSPRWNEFALLHPWMNSSRQRLHAWTSAFIAEIMRLHTQPPYPPLPTRFMFDSETGVFGCCAADWTYMIRNCHVHDVRWNTEQVPGYPAGTTMASLYAAKSAEVEFDLNAGDGTSLHPAFEPAIPIFSNNALQNRPFYQFYTDVTRVVKAAIIEECVYSVIRNAYAAHGAPVPVLFNYGESVNDGGDQDFGWQEDKEPRIEFPQPAGTPVHRYEYSIDDPRNRIITRRWQRIMIDSGNEGAKHGHTCVRDLGNGAFEALARWQSGPTTTWGDRDAVQQYTYRFTPSPVFAHRQRNLYKPGTPQETAIEMCERLNRVRLESTLDSNREPGRRAAFGFPYQAMVGLADPQYGIPTSDDFALTHAALARSKDLTEMALFTDQPVYTCAPPQCSTPVTNLAQWLASKSVYERVYALRVASYEWWQGEGPADTLPHPQDLFFTLRSSGPASPPAVTSASSIETPQFVGQLYSTQLQVQFHPLLQQVCGDRLRIRVEGQAAPVGTPNFDLQPIEGEIALWDYQASGGGQWYPLLVSEVPLRPTHYATTTPDGYTRRTFDVDQAARFVSASGKVAVRLMHSAASLQNGLKFVSSYDLVQVYYLRATACSQQGEGEPEGGCEGCLLAGGQPYGADVNADGLVDETDIAFFADAFEIQSGAADFDGDESVTSDDVTSFIASWATSE